MMKRYLIPATPLAAMLLLTGCMDNNYDLANIDTTSKLNVNGLIVPVNANPLTLDDVMDAEDYTAGTSGKLVKYGTGDSQFYAYIYDGTFESENITIDSFEVVPSRMDDSKVRISLTAPASQAGMRAASSGIAYEIHRTPNVFNYDINNVDESVKSIVKLRTPSVTFSIQLLFPSDIVADASRILVQNLRISFPKELYMADGTPAKVKDNLGVYDPATGILTVSDHELVNGRLDLQLEAQLLTTDTPVVDNTFKYEGEMTVEDGILVLEPKSDTDFPSEFFADSQYDLGQFDVTNFSGNIEYDLDGFDLEDVSMNDLPDFLSGEGTSIVLADPQLYLQMTNPAATYGMSAKTGLSLTPVRNDIDGDVISLDPATPITMGHDNGSGPYNFLVAPDPSKITPLSTYPNPTGYSMPGLSYILAGDGMPQALKVNLDSPAPQAYGYPAEDLPLPTNINKVDGKYTFFAPLTLGAGTEIYYRETKNDWNAEDLKDIHVNEMIVTATATSNIPFDVDLYLDVLDPDGNVIGKGSILVPAGVVTALDIKVLPISGKDEIVNIGGIKYIASCIVKNGSDKPLYPEQSIVLENIRAKLTGYYLYQED
ncbi:MAG: hypothetical protein HDR80_11140 [Bacteroides sp.]|nr:hypothetical protein [Bacteroides sp.]